MVKKFLFFILFAALMKVSNAQQQWVGFTSSEPETPLIKVLSSNAQTVSFEVTVRGIHRIDTTVSGVKYSRFVVPSGVNCTNQAGSPTCLC